jgi:hypothetical protein
MAFNNASFRREGEGQSMKVAWIELGGAASAVVVALLMTAPVRAADSSGVTAVAADELDKRSKQAEASQGKSGGMSESSVRVLMTYAFSLIPAETQGPDGQPVKVDKSDPNKYVIPTEDARRVIRAATRSAYADVCGLPELGEANYKAMLAGEGARKWSREQLLMINALHLFAVSYFTGNAKIIEEPGTTDEAPAAADGTTTVSKDPAAAASAGQDQQVREVEAPPPPKCPPEQKQKVENAINAYVKAAEAGPAGQ